MSATATVTVYSKPDCVQCNATYRALTKGNIDYDVVDVTEDQEAYDRIVGMGFQQVPVVVTDNDQWSGYRPDKIAGLNR